MLTRRMQIEAVADICRGIKSDLPIKKFDDPWYSAYVEVEELDGRQAPLSRLAMVLDREDLGEVTAVLNAEREGYVPFSEMVDSLPEITWLWPGWLPIEMISLVGAAPGAGKSYLALDLARRLLMGEPWPDGAPAVQEAGCVIYIDAENVPQILKARVQQWEMDIRRLYVMLPVEERMFIDFSGSEDRDRLAHMAHTLKPTLIIVDSMSVISSKGENNVEDVRDVLGFLNRVAQDFHSALLLIHHVRKGIGPSGLVTIESFRGSMHIVGIGRSTWGLSIVQTGPKMDPSGPRHLAMVKTNLGIYPPPLGVEFSSMEGGGARLDYGAAPKPFVAPMMADECADWLLRTLEEAGEPIRPRALVEMAREAGFGRSLLYEVRSKLEGEIVNSRGHQDPNNAWALPAMLEDDSG